MRLLVAVDGHFMKTSNNKYWCKTIYSYSFFERYLNIFDDVIVVARVKDVDKLDGKFNRIDGAHVKVRGIPFYQGPKQLIVKWFSIQKALINIDDGCDGALFRLPATSAYMVYRKIKRNLPFAGEIVYDPTDDLKRLDNGILLNVINRIISNNLKRFCLEANGVSYVTENTIQEHYPSHVRKYGDDGKHFESSYSTITLKEDAYIKPEAYKRKESIKMVMCDAAMNTDRKGESIFLRVISKLRDRGIKASGFIIGDGNKLNFYKEMAKKIGINEHVIFTGLLSSASEVRAVLKKSDLFLFPTKAEGLPRGVIEAMAVGMPIIATTVGGIPELIERKYLFEPEDVIGFTDEIERLFHNPDELSEMGKTNYIRALDFSDEKLQVRRDKFYMNLRKLCEENNKKDRAI